MSLLVTFIFHKEQMRHTSLYKNIWCSWQMSGRETKQNFRGCRGWSVLSMYQIFGAFVSLIGKKSRKKCHERDMNEEPEVPSF